MNMRTKDTWKEHLTWPGIIFQNNPRMILHPILFYFPVCTIINIILCH